MTTKVYLYGKKRSKKITLKNKPIEDVQFKEPKDEEIIQPVQGQIPSSKEEYWVALALERLGIAFIYQYSISGGRSVRGGQVIDFLAYTVPLPTPIFVQGEYWHGGTKSDTSQSGGSCHELLWWGSTAPRGIGTTKYRIEKQPIR